MDLSAARWDREFGHIEAATPQATVDSTRVPPAKRLEFWRRYVDRTRGLNVVCATTNFVGRMTTRSLGSFSVHGVTISTPHKAIRANSCTDLCFANIQIRNEGARFNGRREMEIPQGSMLLYEASQPYELDFDGASDSLVVAFAKSELQKRVANLQMHLDEPVNYDPHKVSMLAGLLHGVLSCSTTPRQAVRDGMAEAVVNMLVATLYDCDEVATTRPTYAASAILQRIKSYINANIADPNLNPVMAAEAMGITVGYLHKIFLLSNSTLMQYVLAERLERCRKDIAKADRSGGISQIAFKWGFNDASHFSRSFRKRFGLSPRDYRAQVLQRNASLLAAE